MTRPSTNLRLFAAVYPPADVARWLVNRLRKLTLPPHQPTALEQVHMTLQFIGDRPVSEIEAVIESVQRSAAGLGAFMLEPGKLITLPERGPARLVAAETDAPPTLLEMQRRLAQRLADPARRSRESFRPHLTLCRFNSPRMIEPIDPALQCEPFRVERIALMRSTLDPSGAKHHEVAAVALDGPA